LGITAAVVCGVGIWFASSLAPPEKRKSSREIPEFVYIEPGTGDRTARTPPKRPYAEGDYIRGNPGFWHYDLHTGTGAEAGPGSIVTVDYIGWSNDALRFENTIGKDEPARFVVGHSNVCEGFDLAIAGMRAGGVRQIVVGSDYGGTSGTRLDIPRLVPLVFYIELISVEGVRTPPSKPGVALPWREATPGSDVSTAVVSMGEASQEDDPRTLLTVDITTWNGDGEILSSTYWRPEPKRAVFEVITPIKARPALHGIAPGTSWAIQGPARWLVPMGPGVRRGDTLTTLIEVLAVDAPRVPPEFTPDGDFSPIAEGVSVLDIAEGSGEPPGSEDPILLEVTAWTTEGRPLYTTFNTAGPLETTPTKHSLFGGLAEALETMAPGGIRRVLVDGTQTRPHPANAADDTDVIYEIQLVAEAQ
jgi:FKBP-type peptidyl-prolyl cis-trans isomerase